jgi:hypothetical protein
MDYFNDMPIGEPASFLLLLISFPFVRDNLHPQG